MRSLFKLFKILFLLLVIVAGGTAALLKHGIHLQAISTDEVQLSGLVLVWEEKLELQIESLTIESTSSEGGYPPSQPDLETLSTLSRLFSRIEVASIRYDQFDAQLYYSENPREKSFFNLKSDDLQLLSTIVFQDLGVNIKVTECTVAPFQTKATGDIRVDFNSMIVTGELEANIADSLPVQISFEADSQGIRFQGQESGEITRIKPVVDLFELDPDIQPWITERLTGKRYRLTTFSGNFPWQNPAELLDTLHAEIRIDNCAYVFEKGFEPIRTIYTDVVFDKGILDIKPHEPVFYGQSGEESWLDINFNNPDDIILTAYILTNAVLNDDILRLLQAYDIDLPFKQVQGNTATDLTLAVHLNDEWVEATGSFATSESRMEYENEELALNNAFISIKDSEVTIESADVAFRDSIQAHLSGVYNGETENGTLRLKIKKLHFDVDGTVVTLQDGSAKPEITLTLTPEDDRYQISPINVTAKGMDFLIESFAGPFSPDDLAVGIPPILVVSPQGIQAEVSGSFSIKKQSAELLCTLLRYEVDNVLLTGTRHLPLVIRYQEQLSIRSLDKSSWTYESAPVEFAQTTINYHDDNLSISSDLISYGSIFSAEVTTSYNFAERQGELSLKNSRILQQPLGNLNGQIMERPQSRLINFPDIGVLIDLHQGQERAYTVTIRDLALLHERTPLLQRYEISQGEVTLKSQSEERKYTISGSLPVTLPLLFKNDKEITQFTFEGDFADGELNLTINDDIRLHYQPSEIRIVADNIGFNLVEIVSMLNEENEETEADTYFPAINLTLESHDSYLYFTPINRALADSIHFEYADEKSLLDLRHAQGHVILRSDGYTFTLEGKDLNDKFMGALLQNSTFKGGKMNMVALGDFNNFSGLVKIRDTLLKDHRAFNNVMGFLNTVPALVTFSLPEYNTRGVHLNSVIVGAMVKEGVATIESLEVKSPLFDLTGTGWADFSKRVLDMDINLISRAKTNIRKIPLIGYIIAGEKKRPSVTLEITGDIADPKVTNTMFREVATMPFSMLYRTLKLPVDLVEKLGD